jgi:hypothetical protein
VDFGIWLGMLGALELAYPRTCPHVWNRALGLTSDKEPARVRAMQPYLGADLRLWKHQGQAAALLLVYREQRQAGQKHSTSNLSI